MKRVPTESMHGMVWYGTIPHREHAWGSSGQTEACQVTIASLLQNQNSLKYIFRSFQYLSDIQDQNSLKYVYSDQWHGWVVLWSTLCETPLMCPHIAGWVPNLSPRFLAAPAALYLPLRSLIDWLPHSNFDTMRDF